MAAPVKKFKGGGIEVAVWQGDKGYSLSFQKRYKTKDGEWKESKFLFAEDGFMLAGLMSAAATWAMSQGGVAVASQAVQQNFEDSNIPF